MKDFKNQSTFEFIFERGDVSGSVGKVFLYDCADRESFSKVQEIIEKSLLGFSKNQFMYLLGTKCDLPLKQQ